MLTKHQLNVAIVQKIRQYVVSGSGRTIIGKISGLYV